MANYRAVPATGLEMAWDDGSGVPAVQANLRWDNEAWTFEVGLVAERASVVMRLSIDWAPRQMLLFRDLAEPDLWLATGGGGRWGEVNGAHRTDLDGGTDLVVAGSPVFDSVVIRRLPLHVGDSADVNRIMIDTQTLSMTVGRARYTRTASHDWLVRHGVGSEPDSVTVDEFGFVLDVPGRLQRRPQG